MAKAHLEAGHSGFQVTPPTINTAQADLLTDSMIVYVFVYMYMYMYRYAGLGVWKSSLGSAFPMQRKQESNPIQSKSK